MMWRASARLVVAAARAAPAAHGLIIGFSSAGCSSLLLKTALVSPSSLQRRALSTAGYFDHLVCSRGLMPDPKERAALFRLAAAADPWLSVLPGGKRAKLEAQLDAAATPFDKWEVLRKAAEADDTKVRATASELLVASSSARGGGGCAP
jgi:hypothetical protein